jgi:hypothetical protein
LETLISKYRKKLETLISKYRKKLETLLCRPLPEPEQEAGVGAGNWADPHPGGQLVQEPPPARQSGSRQEQVNTMEERNV